MSKLKRIASMLLALVMVFGLACTAYAADDAGTITITNATKGETYHVYKLFDATYGDSYVDDDGNTVIPTAYVATADQQAALVDEDDNVFEFTPLADGNYQVTKKEGVTDPQVIAFIQSYVLKLSSTVYVCKFPGAVEVYGGSDNVGIENSVATQSTVEINNLPYGYYFVTSSLGSVVSLSTTNPEASIVDKNPSTPDWDNNPDEPEPDDPVKDVLNEEGTRSINKEEVTVTQVLTYSISYTNTSGETLSEVVVYDAAPAGTVYEDDSIAIQILDENGETVTTAAIPDDEADMVESTVYVATDDSAVATGGDLTWTIKNLPDGYTLVATFQVTVTDEAYTLENSTIVNDAELDVTLGENTYRLKTNEVENPVDKEDEPKKDVKTGTDDPATDAGDISIDGEQVDVGDKLTYTISYTNTKATTVDLTIEDAPPAGTVYVAGTAGGTASDESAVTVTVNADGTITWTVDDLAVGATVTVYFQVEVTEVALSITDSTIVNSADYTFDGTSYYKTNEVENPTEPDEPGGEDFGKVIINADGTESKVSTGAFGDTVTFDVSIDAVNLVEDEGFDEENTYNDQVAYYYIYDKMDPGFTLNDGSFILTINGNSITISGPETKSNGVKYYTIDDGTGESFLFTYVDEDGYTFIEAKIAWADADGNAYYPNCEVHLTYTATINEDAVIGSNGNLNRAIYDYSVVGANEPKEPNPEDPKYPSDSDLNHEPDEITTVTYTYALGIYKISKETQKPLSGAKFTFVDAGGNRIYAVPTDVDGVYNYTSDSSASGATDTFVSNSDGKIIIKGVDIGTYTLTETMAPSGYTLLTKSETLKATMTSATSTTYKSSSTVTRTFDAITEDEFAAYTGTVYTKSEDGTFVEMDKPAEYTEGLYKLVDATTSTSEEGVTVVTESIEIEVTSVTVENNAGTSLPGTGGIGTTIFYIVGGLLVCGAVVLLITRKRMKKQ
ncbi:MAG: DUF11 domain-containing protein [Clostridiales bacterium]|nr:DUF11 domain-containing protein [Clostridiales bacterium]